VGGGGAGGKRRVFPPENGEYKRSFTCDRGEERVFGGYFKTKRFWVRHKPKEKASKEKPLPSMSKKKKQESYKKSNQTHGVATGEGRDPYTVTHQKKGRVRTGKGPSIPKLTHRGEKDPKDKGEM